MCFMQLVTCKNHVARQSPPDLHFWVFFFSKEQFTKKKNPFMSSYNQISIGLNAPLNLLGILERCQAPLLRNVRIFFFFTRVLLARVFQAFV